ncbi:hypothetical protein [Hymenobacter ruricola]|uniref:Uncharacterized protein n=1 Tax=Hymenobacter ruricola TaxID=2791023 RepID=A0ABS0I5U7_9BACT|nr:hypothetical protein [Hymenobacter ruricola]MBF9222323.1 hypothetical protein [Hymenobacter ruricola]
MATNTGKGHRVGAVRGKTQTFNPSTGQYIKRDADTGRFEAVKKDGTPFKGVTKEKLAARLNPNIPPETLLKAQKAVALVMKRRAA